MPQALGEVVKLRLVGKYQQEVNKYSVKMEKSTLVLKTKVLPWRGLPMEIILRLRSERSEAGTHAKSQIHALLVAVPETRRQARA